MFWSSLPNIASRSPFGTHLASRTSAVFLMSARQSSTASKAAPKAPGPPKPSSR
jgi:hypothetical protein